MKNLTKSILIISAVASIVSPALALPNIAKHLSTGQMRSALSRLLHRSSFSESWSRYPSPDSIIESLRQDFPYATNSTSYNYASSNAVSCGTLDSKNRVLLGEADPINGLASVDEPTSSFTSWYFGCTASIIGLERQEFAYKPRTLAEMQSYYSPEVMDDCLRNQTLSSNQVPPAGLYCSWTSLSGKAKHAMINNLVNRFVGPEEVLVNQGIAASETEYENSVIAEIDNFANSPDSRYAVLNLNISSDKSEKLAMTDSAAIAAFLIHLQDTLKY